MPTVFEQCHAFLMIHEVSANPLDPANWTGKVVGGGTFVAPDGGLDMSREDSGNWTGGAVGVGMLGGTKWGISTAAYQDAVKLLPQALRSGYPALVKDLTLADARELTRWGWWKPSRCDALPPRLALFNLDAAFNNGVGAAGRWLQTAVGAAVDGAVGEKTLAAVQRAVARDGVDAIAAEVLAERLDFMARLPTWRINGFGWARRLVKLSFQAVQLPAV